MAASFFAQLEGLAKPTPAVRLVIEGVGALLGCQEEELSTRHRVPPHSRYSPTVALLAGSFAPTMERLLNLDFALLSNGAAEGVYVLVRHANFSEAKAREQGDPLGELAQLLLRVDAGLAEQPGRKPVAAAAVAVAIDGSRMSHNAFDVACHLRGAGTVDVVHVSDPSKSYLPPQLKPEYIKMDFETQCVARALPSGSWGVRVVPKEAGTSTRDMILQRAAAVRADVLVLGAFGRKGPSIFNVGSVTDYSVRSSAVTAVIVKPCSVVPDRVIQGSRDAYLPATWVCAVDGTTNSHRACETAMRLMRPQDSLHVLHIRHEYVAGALHSDASGLVEEYEALLRVAGIDGGVSMQEAVPEQTIAQQICAFAEDKLAHYCAIGVDGMSAHAMGGGAEAAMGSNSDQVVKECRCTVVMCKEGVMEQNELGEITTT
jgi:nucleotide-binding universal stress UspA family protein